MTLEVEVFNFQSIPHQKFTFEPGLTSLTGRGNVGKSSAVRAINTLLFNDWDRGFLRKGTKECVTRGTFVDEPHDVMALERTRSERRNSLSLTMRDGTVRTFDKMGGEIPAELAAIGLYPVVVERGSDRESYNLCTLDQFQPLFLVTLTPPPVTSFVNRVFEIEKWERTLRSLISDSQKLHAAYDDRASVLLQVDTDLVEATASRDETERAVLALDATLATLDTLAVRREAVAYAWVGMDGVDGADRAARSFATRAAEFRTLLTPTIGLEAALARRGRLLALRADLSYADAAMARATARLDTLTSLVKPLGHLAARASRWLRAGSLRREADAAGDRVRHEGSRVAGLTDFAAPIAELAHAARRHLDARLLRDKLRVPEQDMARHAAVQAALAPLDAPLRQLAAILARCAASQAIVERLARTDRDIDRIEGTASAMRALWPDIHSARDVLRLALGVCPYCQTPLLAGAHSHG